MEFFERVLAEDGFVDELEIEELDAENVKRLGDVSGGHEYGGAEAFFAHGFSHFR